MNRRHALSLCALALVLVLLPFSIAYSQAPWLWERDDWDQSHATFDEVRQKLEAMGYRDVVQYRAWQRGPWLHAYATSPDGQRVRALFDNTANLIWIRPLRQPEGQR